LQAARLIAGHAIHLSGHALRAKPVPDAVHDAGAVNDACAARWVRLLAGASTTNTT
jgi:hypothetical protein